MSLLPKLMILGKCRNGNLFNNKCWKSRRIFFFASITNRKFSNPIITENFLVCDKFFIIIRIDKYTFFIITHSLLANSQAISSEAFIMSVMYESAVIVRAVRRQ